jgi:alkanesulfonate monooxygenase
MRKLEFGWFIPTRGDTDDYGDPIRIAAGVEMFDRVAIAAEKAGFEYMLIPVGHQCWDAWMTGAMMTRKTTKMRMLIAARPSYINPVLLAKMIATFDQLSQGRISVNLIAGQSEAENIAEGVRWSKEQRYEIMDEEVSILKALWTQTGPTDWNGKYYTLVKAELTPKPYQKPHPKFYLGGGSGQAAELSAKHSDVHLFWGDTTEQIVANMKTLLSTIAELGGFGAITPAAYGMHSNSLPPFKAPPGQLHQQHASQEITRGKADRCPNIRPAFSLLNEMKFTHAHLLNLEHNIKTDWVAKGYPQ